MNISLSASGAVHQMFKFFTELTVEQQAWFVNYQTDVIDYWYDGEVSPKGFKGVKGLTLSADAWDHTVITDFYKVCWCIRKVFPETPPQKLYRITKLTPGDISKRHLVEGQIVKFSSKRSTMTSWSDRKSGVEHYLNAVEDNRTGYILFEYSSPDTKYVLYTREQMQKWLATLADRDFRSMMIAYVKDKDNARLTKLIASQIKNIRGKKQTPYAKAREAIKTMSLFAHFRVKGALFRRERETLLHIPEGKKIRVKIVRIHGADPDYQPGGKFYKYMTKTEKVENMRAAKMFTPPTNKTHKIKLH